MNCFPLTHFSTFVVVHQTKPTARYVLQTRGVGAYLLSAASDDDGRHAGDGDGGGGGGGLSAGRAGGTATAGTATAGAAAAGAAAAGAAAAGADGGDGRDAPPNATYQQWAALLAHFQCAHPTARQFGESVRQQDSAWQTPFNALLYVSSVAALLIPDFDLVCPPPPPPPPPCSSGSGSAASRATATPGFFEWRRGYGYGYGGLPRGYGAAASAGHHHDDAGAALLPRLPLRAADAIPAPAVDAAVRHCMSSLGRWVDAQRLRQRPEWGSGAAAPRHGDDCHAAFSARWDASFGLVGMGAGRSVHLPLHRFVALVLQVVLTD